MPDAGCADTLGKALLDAAFLFRAGAIRALLPEAGPAPQQARQPPERPIVVVADSSFAALELLDTARHKLCTITRLRLDAALSEHPSVSAPSLNSPLLDMIYHDLQCRSVRRGEVRWQRDHQRIVAQGPFQRRLAAQQIHRAYRSADIAGLLAQ